MRVGNIRFGFLPMDWPHLPSLSKYRVSNLIKIIVCVYEVGGISRFMESINNSWHIFQIYLITLFKFVRICSVSVRFERGTVVMSEPADIFRGHQYERPGICWSKHSPSDEGGDLIAIPANPIPSEKSSSLKNAFFVTVTSH